MLGLGASLAKGGASLLTYVKDNLKLYLDFKSSRSDTLAFPSDGSTSFDGNDYISITDSNTLTIADGQGFTASIWFKTSTATEMYLFDNRSSSEGFTAIINANGTNYLGHIHDGSNALQFTNTENYNDGAWHHFAFTFNGTDTITSYIDGSSVGTGTQALGEVNGGSLLIGKPTASDTKYWNGKMANLAMWSRDLSPEEINSVMNKSYSQLGSVEKTSLVSWWALDNAVLGSELITDGDFSSSDNWAETNGWTIDTAQQKAIYVPPENNSSYNIMAYTDATLNVSAEYEITITIDSCDNFSNCGILVGGAVRNFNPTLLNSTGTTTFSFVLGRTDFRLWSQNASITISNVSVKEKNVHTDSKGSNNGVNVGATTTTSVYGGNAPILPRAIDIAESFADAIGNGSASFTASNADYIQISDNSIFTGNGGFSVTCWIKFDSISGNTCIVAKHADYGDVDNAGEFYIINDDGACEFVVVDDTNSASKGQIKTSAFAVDTWYHLACTYNGGTPNSSCKIYINGIFQTQSDNATGSGFASINNTTQPLTIGAFADEGEPHDGNISAVGFWQNALTQSQIQSLMESTSYAKIPASVKSNLGSEIASNNFGGWTLNGWTDNGDNTVSANNSSGGNQDLTISYSFTASTLYKITATFSNISGNFHYSMDGTGGLDKTITTNGEQILYIKTSGSGASSFFIRSTNSSSATISNVSIKEVTNDLVAYYPLDEAKHLAPSGVPVYGAVEDATTGENLGAELFTGWINTDCETFNYNSSTKEVTATTNGSNQEIHTSFSTESGKVYRIEFTTGANYSNTVYLRGIVNDTSLEGYSSSPEINRAYFGTENTYVFYIKATATGTKYIGFRGGSGLTIHITNFSVKKADSNMGLLK